MADVTRDFAHVLVHSSLSRRDQIVGLVWQVYPSDVALDDAMSLLESSGMPKQNKTRVRNALRTSGLVTQGSNRGGVRINPRHKERLDKIYRPLLGIPKRIDVSDSEAVLPAGTLPLKRFYICEIVRQINEGFVATHYDAVAVMLRRLVESLLIECYVAHGRQGAIQNGSSFFMLDQLVATFENDSSVAKSRNVIRQLRRVKDIGDTAAHSRTYITKRADISEVTFDARRAISELSALAGL